MTFVHRRPKRIILIRHGESMGNVDKTVYARYVLVAFGAGCNRFLAFRTIKYLCLVLVRSKHVMQVSS